MPPEPIDVQTLKTLKKIEQLITEYIQAQHQAAEPKKKSNAKWRG